MFGMRYRVAAAFAAVYTIWGSTYLAIRFVIETIPPFFMAGTRFILAGLIMYTWARIRGSSRPTLLNWRSAAIVGGLMLLCGNGGVIWSEQYITSGLVAVFVGIVPLWLVLLDSLFRRKKPSFTTVAGIALGFFGLILLINPLGSIGGDQVHLQSALLLPFTSLLWAAGSLYSRSEKLPQSGQLAVAMEMLTGGILLLIFSGLTGELTQVRFDLISEQSLAAWIYLIIFGSLIAFSCYIWILKVSTPSRVATYAYVNPVVALFLGWALANEAITIQNIIATIIILTSVVVITIHMPQRARQTC
jgi:drug/metabolite transporter (DMT)-like permease